MSPTNVNQKIVNIKHQIKIFFQVQIFYTFTTNKNKFSVFSGQYEDILRLVKKIKCQETTETPQTMT